MTLLAIGMTLCGWEYGSQFWGNWLHTLSFNIGLALICVVVSLFAGTAWSRQTGLYTAFLAFFAIGFFLWTYPGWLILHALLSKLLR
jgi:hypothetical protein